MRRLIFTNNVGKNENKYIVGSNIGSQSRFVKSALLRRSSNNSSGECCILPGPALVSLIYTINVTVNNNGTPAYVFNGHDRLGVITKDITINLGDTLVFNLNVTGHPFIITDSNDIEIDDIAQRETSGTLTWKPSIVGQFIYKCQVHPSSMTGNIFVN